MPSLARVIRRRSQLLQEINRLAKVAEWCVASNNYLSKRMNSSLRTIERDIAALVAEGRLEVATSFGEKNQNPAYELGSYFRHRRCRVVQVAIPLPDGAVRLSNGVILESDWKLDPTLRCVASAPAVPASASKEVEAVLAMVAQREAEKRVVLEVVQERVEELPDLLSDSAVASLSLTFDYSGLAARSITDGD